MGWPAEARPPDAGRDATAGAEVAAPEQWENLGALLDLALRDTKPTAELPARLRLVHERADKLGQRHVDATPYHLIHAAGHSTERYSSHHALLVMPVCEQAAPALGWPAGSVRSLGCAALSMNVAMAALQDQLAASDAPPTAAMREQIQRQTDRGARLLRDAGLDDALWCETVRLHHGRDDGRTPLDDLPSREIAMLYILLTAAGGRR